MTAQPIITGLEGRLLEHAKAFDLLISLIPAKLYLPPKEDAEISTKYMHNKRKRTDEEKETIKKKINNAKRAKLDPQTFKSTIDQVNEAQSAETQKSRQAAPSSTNAANSVTDLRAKLQARIAELRAKRGVEEEKPKSRQDLIARREAKKKEKEDRKKKNKKEKEKNAAASGSNTMSVLEAMGGMVVEDKKRAKVEKDATQLVEDISFGQVAVGDNTMDELTGEKKKSKKMDLKAALAKAEKQQQKLEGLSAKNPEKAEKLKEQQVWDKALKQAAGEKVKDDVKLLKKSIKKVEGAKKKSAKQWGERKATVRKAMADRQKKREENIQKKKEEKQSKGKKKSTAGKSKAKAGKKSLKSKK